MEEYIPRRGATCSPQLYHSTLPSAAVSARQTDSANLYIKTNQCQISTTLRLSALVHTIFRAQFLSEPQRALYLSRRGEYVLIVKPRIYNPANTTLSGL
jgi:hypothetical protein